MGAIEECLHATGGHKVINKKKIKKNEIKLSFNSSKEIKLQKDKQKQETSLLRWFNNIRRKKNRKKCSFDLNKTETVQKQAKKDTEQMP